GDFNPRTNMRDVGLRPARVDDHVATEVVGRMALPAINYLASLEIDGVQNPCVELSGIEPALIGAQGDAANKRAHFHLPGNGLASQVDFADAARIVVRDPSPRAVLPVDNAIPLLR